MAETGTRVAVVGAGLMGRWHADAAARCGAAVVGVVDPDPARAGALAVRHGARAYASLDELLGATATRTDVVHVCTPLASHVELARAAIAAGADAIVEKPLAPDSATTEALLATAAEHGRRVVPVHQFAFQSGVRSLLARLPELGALRSIDFATATAGADGLDDAGRDELVADVLPHPLSLFERIAPRSTAIEWSVLRPASGELRALGGAGDVSLAIEISTRARPTRNELTIAGERATVHLDLYHGFGVWERGSATRSRKVARPFLVGASTLGAAGANLVRRAARREPAYPGLRELVDATYAATDGGPPPFISDEILAVARARDAILARPS